MTRRWLIGGAVLAGALFLLATSVPGQTGYKAPRTGDGKPNLNGIWQALTSAHWDVEAHPAAPGPMWELGAQHAIQGGAGIVEGGSLPYTPEGLAKKKENFANRLKLDPEIKCYLPGVPRGMYMPYPFQIIQSPKYIMMVFEYAGAVRTIYMDNTEAPAPTWMGWSNGRWDGDTLVITTTDYLDTTWFDRAGNHHSDEMRTVERISARSPETLNYEITITDPKTFTKPFKMSLPLYRRVEPNAQLTEYRCVEFSEEMLYGHLKKKASE
jgi:hypothetical protein